MRFLSILALGCLAFAAACGDDSDDDDVNPRTSSTSSAGGGGGQTSSSDATSSSTGTPGECPVLTVTESVLLFGGAGTTGVTMRVDPSLAGYDKTRLTLELYEGDGLPALAPGSFELGTAPDDNYGTCQHCNLLVAYDGFDNPRAAFFQTGGSMTMDAYDPDTRFFAGQIDGLHLVEVTQSPEDFSWHEVEHGRCFDVAPFSFDTRPVDGGPCEKAEDCQNEAIQACDPVSKTCVTAPCALGGKGPFCSEDQRCLSQIGSIIGGDQGGPTAGACYVDCKQGDGVCGDGETCLALGPVQDAGVCLPTGTAAIGEACNLPDISTGCAPGGMCDEPGICRQTCTFLQPQAGCASDTFCTQVNVCRPLDEGDIAQVGTDCDVTSPLFTDCGPEGDAFRGLCVDLFEGQPKECLRVCHTESNDCPGSDDCLAVFGNPLIGICHPPPVCGDGTLDLVGGEVCDDANTDDGDGCSADCTTVDLAALCALAEPLVDGVLTVGSNVNGVTGFSTSCSGYPYSPSKVYSFTPPGPGKLSLQLDSAKTLQISVLGDCTDPASELGCSADQQLTGSQTLIVNFEAGGQPVVIVVRGDNPLEVGNFFLLPTFAPAVCGDGDIAGIEACDDGNVVSGDGCSGDCSTVVWSEVCAAIPPLDLVDPMTGTVDASGSQFFDLDGVCSNSGTTERTWKFTAPSDGTLTLTIDSTDDLVAYANSGCAAVESFDTFVACINWPPTPGEPRTTTASLLAGQEVTVVVEGFRASDTGPFTLSASFGP